MATTNKVTISGKIAEIESRQGLTKAGVPYLAGNVKVEAGTDNLIPVGFFVTQKTKDGKPNQIYNSIVTVVSDYKTIAEHGRDAADVIEITGANLDENIFFPAPDRMVRGFNVRSSFYNRKADAGMKNEFVVSGQILSMVDEIKKEGSDEVPTGNLIIRLLTLGYENKANVLDFKVVNPKGVAYLRDTCSVGQEIKLNGEILIHEEVTEKIEEVAFGDPIVTQSRRTERNLIVASATPPIDSTYSQDVVEASLAAREAEINQKKADAAKSGNGAPKKDAKAAFTL